MVTAPRGLDTGKSGDSGMLASGEMLPWGGRQYFPLPTTADNANVVYSCGIVKKNLHLLQKNREWSGENLSRVSNDEI